MASKKQQKREVLVLVRYTLKQDYAPKGLHAGDVVLLVRNDQGKEYYVTLRRNKAHSCTCVSRKICYHITTMVEQENARHAAYNASRKVVVLPAQEPVSPVEPTPLKRDMLKSALTSNSGFQLLKVS